MKGACILQPGDRSYRVMRKPDMVHCRAFHATIAYGNKLYVLGGKDHMEVATRNFESF
jgi:hypothetical protein